MRSRWWRAIPSLFSMPRVHRESACTPPRPRHGCRAGGYDPRLIDITGNIISPCVKSFSRLRLQPCLASALLPWPSPPPALPTSARTAADLAAICLPDAQASQRLQAIAYCQGFVTAAGQYHALLHRPGGPWRPLYCLPDPTPSVAQTAIAFATWVQQNSQYGNEPPLDGLIRWVELTRFRGRFAG